MMQSIFKIPVEQLNTDFIAAMKEKYADAELEIRVNRKPSVSQMKDAEFWAIIDLLNWEQEKDEEIVAPVIDKLISLPVVQIYQFQDLLSEKLYQLDRQMCAEQIGESSFRPSKYFSVDVFLYARACVVANGKEIYEAVIKDPNSMPKDITFEPILHVASTAFQRKTGDPFLYMPLYDYETYANKVGWEQSKN